MTHELKTILLILGMGIVAICANWIFRRRG